MAIRRITIPDLQKMKVTGEKFTLLTAYDCLFAGLIEETSIEIILVGDSLGMVVMGYDSTLPVTLDQIIHHTQAVAATAHRPLIVADMPFGSFEPSDEEAIRNAQRAIKVGGAQAVKIEGSNDLIRRRIGAVVRSGVPVMAHMGLTPQTANILGGFRVQGRDAGAASKILEEARALQDEGIFALLLECVPAELAKIATAEMRVPVIGIGAGPHCDGQAAVIHDMLGLYPTLPKHARAYCQLRQVIAVALAQLQNDVKSGRFPGEENTFHMKEEEARRLTS